MISRLLRRLRQLSESEPPSRRVELRPGDLLSVVTHGGKFGVMKVLAVDEGGVHVRLYVQRFDERPSESELGDLSLGSMTGPGEAPFSIGHMPISHRSFVDWRAQLITRGRAVDAEELEGHQMWQEARGGYF